jgi:hypothetical protein
MVQTWALIKQASFTAIRHRMWDDKEDPSMFDEMLEGGGHSQILTYNPLGHGPFFYAPKCGINGSVVRVMHLLFLLHIGL